MSPEESHKQEAAPFTAGETVRLRDGLSEDVLKAIGGRFVRDIIYEITEVDQNEDEGDASVWIRPLGSSEQAFPISVRHLARA